jgi:hypothetical protein
MARCGEKAVIKSHFFGKTSPNAPNLANLSIFFCIGSERYPFRPAKTYFGEVGSLKIPGFIQTIKMTLEMSRLESPT